jgi:hypothetical protein
MRSVRETSLKRHWERRSARPVRSLERTANGPTTMTQTISCKKQTWRRQPSREIVVDRIGRGREVSGTFPKPAIYCHLLPFWSGKIATSVSIVRFPILPLEGCRPAWAQAENRERAVRSLGGSTLVSSPVTTSRWPGSSWRQPASPRRESLGSGGVALRASTPATPLWYNRVGCLRNLAGLSIGGLYLSARRSVK